MVEIGSWITATLAGGGGGAAFAYGLFKLFGSKWLEGKFATRLQEHKHAQDIELQRLRIEIDSMLNGVLKLQEREFQVLPELWEKIHEAYRNTNWFISPLQSSPDLTTLDTQELEIFLKGVNWLNEAQQQKILDSSDRNKEYRERFFWHQSSIAFKSIKELQLYTDRIGIFLPDAIFEKTIKLYSRQISLTTICESIHRHNSLDETLEKKTEQEQKAAEDIYHELKVLITNQLRSYTKHNSDQ